MPIIIKNRLQCPNCKYYDRLMNVGVVLMGSGFLSIGMAAILTVLIITIPVALIMLVLSPVMILAGFIVWLSTRGQVRCMKCGWSRKRRPQGFPLLPDNK